MRIKCNNYREFMSSFLDNELSPHEVNLLGGHLKVCLDCQEELRELESLKALFQHYVNSRPYPRPSLGFATEVIETTRGESKTNNSLSWSRFSIFQCFSFLRWQTYNHKWITATAVSLLSLLVIGIILLTGSFKENLNTKLVYDLKSSEKGVVVVQNRNSLEDYLEEHAITAAKYPIAGNKGLIEYIKNSRK